MKSIAVWIALLTMVLGLPLALKKVPMNSVYGFRTQKTMSSPEIWYEANRQSGFNLIVAGGLTILAWGVLRMGSSPVRAGLVAIPLSVIFVLGSFAVSLLQLRKL